MKYMFQFGLIAGICFVAEVLKALLPFPVPASIYGLLILFLLLMTKVVKLEQVEDAADFLLAVMPIVFIEPSVALMTSFDVLKGKAVAIVLVCVVSTVVTNAVTGRVSQTVIRARRKKASKGEKSNESE